VGDEFVSIGGNTTQDWQSVYLALLQHVGELDNIDVVVRQFPDKPLRDYSLPMYTLDNNQKSADRNPLTDWGVTLGLPHIPALLGEVVPGAPAAVAGLQKNDKIVAVDGTPVKDWYDLVEYVRARPQQAIEFTIERAGHVLVKTITPAAEEVEGVKIGAIGVKLAPEAMPVGFSRLQRENPLNALYKSVINTWDLSILTFDIMGKMIIGLVGLDNLSGPISIAQGAQQSVSTGWMPFVSFLILISVNLGVINLLPIPMLDGGHLLYYVIELVRGKPVSEKVQKIGLLIGFVFVIGLMLVGIHNDIKNF
jgi:regulator of sigma E protease